MLNHEECVHLAPQGDDLNFKLGIAGSKIEQGKFFMRQLTPNFNSNCHVSLTNDSEIMQE
jgi:hypothetical protein